MKKWPEVKDFLRFCEDFIGNISTATWWNQYAYRVRNADAVCNLRTSHSGARPAATTFLQYNAPIYAPDLVHFRWILARKSATAVVAAATIGILNNLAPGKAAVSPLGHQQQNGQWYW